MTAVSISGQISMRMSITGNRRIGVAGKCFVSRFNFGIAFLDFFSAHRY
jgi:hypothetical protein